VNPKKLQMKNWILGLAALALTLPANAQELPQPSPTSTIDQRIGLTDFSITYSRPATRGRSIFGDLVPYNQVWRTGANRCVILNASTDFTMNGNAVIAGEYALFTIPGETEWTIILSTQTDLWGSTGYSQDNDVVRVTAPAAKSDFDESFTIGFKSLSTTGGELVLEWADAEVSVNLGVDSDGESGKNIERALSDAKRAYRNAANYYSGQGDHEKALASIEIALQLDPEYWYTNWVKAKILYAAGDTKAALKQGKKAMDMGAPDSYRAGYEKEMKGWK
jgi:tetratricopeptide (TPR) repeat protein